MFNAENQIQSALEKVSLLPRFAGVLPPSVDYDETLRGLRRLPDYIDVDLSVARSIGALSALLIPISGNSFYIDQGATSGNATIHFQDASLGLTCPFFVGPGFISTFPFTQLLLENTAQAGKILRIIYGTDLKFQAAGVLGLNTVSVKITDNNGILYYLIGANGLFNQFLSSGPVIESGYGYGTSVAGNAINAANTAVNVFTPAANVNGAVVWAIDNYFVTAAAGRVSFLAKNAAPATIIDGDVILSHGQNAATQGANISLYRSVRIAAGKGLYRFNDTLESANSLFKVLFTLL